MNICEILHELDCKNKKISQEERKKRKKKRARPPPPGAPMRDKHGGHTFAGLSIEHL